MYYLQSRGKQLKGKISKDITHLSHGDTSGAVPGCNRDAPEKQIPLSAASVVRPAKGDLVGGAEGCLMYVWLFSSLNAPLDASALH